jgi:ribosome maturation protein Sdo1
MTIKMQILKRIGGNEWKNDEKGIHRVYFDNLVDWYGLEGIRKDQESKIRSVLKRTKVWYDVKTGKISYTDTCRESHDSMMVGQIFETIKKNIIARYKLEKQLSENQVQAPE